MSGTKCSLPISSIALNLQYVAHSNFRIADWLITEDPSLFDALYLDEREGHEIQQISHYSLTEGLDICT